MSLHADYPFQPAAWKRARTGDDLWLIPGIIPLEGLVVLASAPKTGKTCLATAIARALATGGEFLGHRYMQTPVLWCAHEEVPDERGLLHDGLDDDDPLYIAYPGELPTIDAPEPYLDRDGEMVVKGEPAYVFDHAARLGARLIVVDCLHAAVEKGNLADNHFARRVMGRLRRLSHRRGIAVLVLHHLTKSSSRASTPDRFADSAQILASASCHFYMDRVEGEDGTSRIVLHGQGRHPAPARKLELVSRGVLDYEIAKPETGTTRAERVSAFTRIRDLLAEGWELTGEEIARRLDLKPATVRESLARLTNEGRAEKLPTGTRRSRYRLCAEP